VGRVLPFTVNNRGDVTLVYILHRLCGAQYCMGIQVAQDKETMAGDAVTRRPLKGKRPSPGVGMSGAPSTLSEEVQNSFIEYVLRGLPPPRACDLVGISERTYHKWMQNGKRYSDDLIDGEQNDIHDIYYSFYREVNRAIAMWMIRFVDRLSASDVDQTWTRDLAVLERRDKSNWGRDSDHNFRGRDEFPSDEAFL
jgi:hypothetical protein